MRLLICALTLLVTSAVAAPPPFGEWILLRVGSCQPVIFGAPDSAEVATAQGYAEGEKRRVVLVTGLVVSAANFTSGGAWSFSFQPPANALVGKEYIAVVDEPTSGACPVNLPAEKAYVRVWGCDVGWRKGNCIYPFPQLTPAERGGPYEFVMPRP